MRTHARVAAALLLPAALLLGCSDDDQDGGDPKTDNTAEATLAAYFGALADADYPAACERLTEEYRARTVEEWNSLMDEKTDTCEKTMAASVEMLKAFTDAKDSKALWKYEGLSATEDGDSATATVRLIALQDQDSTYSLEKVKGIWLVSGDDSDSVQTEAEASDVIEGSVGEELPLGDWAITVLEVDRAADKLIADAADYNEPAKHRYVMVTFEATYDGDERIGDIGTVLWKLTDAEKKVHESAWTLTTPGDVASWPTEVRAGGTLKRQVVFDIDPALLEGGILSVETVDGDFQSHIADIGL